jgi:ABC-type multidrug transport system fused ATPase/permease subunit
MIQSSTLWVGGNGIAHGDMTYGEFIQFWFYVAMLVSPIRELGERYNVLQSAFASSERIFQVLDTRSIVPNGPTRLAPSKLTGHLRFENVSFSYDGSVEAIGTHESLLAQGGRYAELFELQPAGYR